MELLNEIRISNFRSLRDVRLEGLADYNPLIGLNSTGKSNVLRALNLYFNDHLDEERTPLSLDRDYPRGLESARRRKLVSVGAVFNLGTGYRPRNSETYLSSNGYSDQIAVQRQWSLSPLGGGLLQDTLRVGVDLDSLGEVQDADRPVVFAFVRAVHFRYVPNHVRPADFIRTEVQPLRTSLLANLRRTKAYKDAGVGAAMEGLSDVAQKMLAGTSDKISVGNLGRGISADVPGEFSDLAFQIALQTVTPNGLEPTELQGSGTQSFTLLHVLDLLDRTERGQQFGWKKASIWAIEEPESFLHAGLRARFAQDLADYAGDDRRQIMVSTHHEEFVRVGESTWLADIADGQTKVSKMDARDALSEASRRRITAFQHPLMEYADFPIVLVEGKFDGVHLRAAMKGLKLRPRWKLVVMSDLDSAYKPGGSALATYLGANRAVINSRALSAPVIILRDWEDGGGNLSAFSAPLAGHASSTVLCCPETLSNPQLGATFRGIERYLSTALVKSVVAPADLTRPASGEYPLNLSAAGRTTYTNTYKAKLAAAVRSGKPPGKDMRRLVEWLDGQVVAALSGVPVQLFL